MEMTRTPDEIKKGLECCSNVNFVCNEECPYYKSLSEGEDCCLKKNADALALIQQLQAENAEKDVRIQQLEKRVIHLEALNQSNLTTITMQERTRARLQERISQLEAERDALMHWAKGRCDTCAHKDDCVKHDPDPEGYVMRWYDDCEIWEWCGVQTKEDTNDQ